MIMLGEMLIGILKIKDGREDMTKILKGAPVSAQIRQEIEEKLELLTSKGIEAKIATVRLGSNPDDVTYEKNILRNCERMGIATNRIVKDNDISTEEFLTILEELNQDETVSGILLLSLLTTRDDQEIIRRAISPEKDIDGIHPLNLEKIFRGETDGLAPCAARAAVELLDFNEIELAGKNVVIINRSMVIGKPLAMMLLERDSTVTICHSRTKDMKSITKRADIVLTAIGRANHFDRSYFNKDAIVLDIGIDFDEDGKLTGDLDFDDLMGEVAMITPVPGGIGGITTSILLKQAIESAVKNRL